MDPVLEKVLLTIVGILVTSLIVGTILLCHQNSYCAICFAGTFSSLVLCTSILNECKEVDKSEEEK